MGTFKSYQQEAAKTARTDLVISDQRRQRLAIAAMGLSGESGEVVELLKKWIGHGHELDLDKVAKELGDVLWYIAEICTVLELDLESDVAGPNLEKLKARYGAKFTEAKSRNRG